MDVNIAPKSLGLITAYRNTENRIARCSERFENSAVIYSHQNKLLPLGQQSQGIETWPTPEL